MLVHPMVPSYPFFIRWKKRKRKWINILPIKVCYKWERQEFAIEKECTPQKHHRHWPIFFCWLGLLQKPKLPPLFWVWLMFVRYRQVLLEGQSRIDTWEWLSYNIIRDPKTLKLCPPETWHLIHLLTRGYSSYNLCVWPTHMNQIHLIDLRSGAIW